MDKRDTVEALNRLIQPNVQVKSERFEELIDKAETLMTQHMDVTCDDNRLPEIMATYAQALELEPASSEVMANMAWVEMKQGRFKQAIQLAEKSVAVNEKSSKAYFVLGFIAYQEGYHADSYQLFKKAMSYSRFGQNSAIQFYLAQNTFQWTSKRSGFFTKSLGYTYATTLLVASAVTYLTDKKTIPAKYFVKILPNIIKGYYYEEKGRYQDALMIYLKLYDEFPGMPNLTNVIGDLYYKMKQSHEAMYWFQKTVKRHPYNEDALVSIAKIYEEKKDYTKALSYYQTLRAATPAKAEVHCSIANNYYYQEDMANALYHYQSALTLSDDDKWKALVAQSIGNLHLDVWENVEAAKQSYHMAMELDPSNVDVYIQLAMLHYRAEDFENALHVYNRALSMDPVNPRIHANMGYLYWIQDDLTPAINHYNVAIELDSFYEIPYNNLGVIYLDCVGDVQKAIRLLEKAASLNESYSLAFYNLGRAYSFIDQPVKAAEYFRKAQQLNRYTHDLDNEELEARILSLFDSNFEVLLDNGDGHGQHHQRRMM